MKTHSNFISNSSSCSFILKSKNELGEQILKNIRRIEVVEKNELQIKEECYSFLSNYIMSIDYYIKILKKEKILSTCINFKDQIHNLQKSIEKNRRLFETECKLLNELNHLLFSLNLEEKNCFQKIFKLWKKFKKITISGQKNLVVDSSIRFKCETDISWDNLSDVIEGLKKLDLIEIISKETT